MYSPVDDDVELANQTGTFFVQKIEIIRSEHDNMAQGLPSLFDDRTPVAPPPLSKFSLLSEEARKLISSSAKKSCTLDPLPTSLVVDCIDVLLPIITNMLNLLLESGLFVDLPTSRAQKFFTSAKRERQIFYVFCGKSERESKSSTCFPCKKSHQVTSFWRKLFASLSRVLSRACVVASCQSMSKQTNNGQKVR